MAFVSSPAAGQLRADESRPFEGATTAGGASPRRRREAGLEIRQEVDRDYEATAALADAGFGFAPGCFRPDILRWLYDTAFTDGTTVLALWSDGGKVGQVALVHQTVVVAGRPVPAIALVDLFILKEHRSLAAIAALYGAVEKLCRQDGIRIILAMPNGKAAGVNQRFLKLAEAARLDIRVGVSGLPRPWHRVASHHVEDLDPARGREILDAFCGSPVDSGGHVGSGHGDRLLWTGARLWSRLQKPGARYAIHAGRDALLVSAPRLQGRLPHTMLCGFFVRPGTQPGRGAVAALVSAACRHQRRPLFVYAGINGGVPLPGILLPERLRPSPMVLQLRDLHPDGQGAALSRFEALDFDFA